MAPDQNPMELKPSDPSCIMPPMKTILASLALLLLFLGCATPQQKATGFLQGHLSIGPLCPVERIPPDPNCQPTEQTYKAYPIAVYETYGSKDYPPENYAQLAGKVAEIVAGKNGDYKIRLPAGTYEVRQESGLHKFSKKAEILAHETTKLDIEIDTGIR